MKMQTLRVGVASLAAAALISVGVTAPTAGAAPAVKTNSNVLTLNQDLINQIAQQYGIDLNKISFGGITIKLPINIGDVNGGTGTTTKPGTGNSGSGSTTKPGTGNSGSGSTTKPGTGNSGSGSTTKPGTGNSGSGSTTKPGTGNSGSGSTTKPGTGNSGSGSTTQPGTGNNGSASMSQFQQQVVDLVNQERAKAGLSPLAVDSLLTKVATEKARDMDVNHYFSHTSPTYGSPFDMMKQFGVTYSYAGENIAAGQRTPQEVMTAWMNSPGHRANILNANFKKIGVGFVNNQWVQEFTG
ncbi:CAP domain-containing protein [Paenibacillus gorillae]|uniref:CAP domain-containing protein n=1 Tax=Paenibacillus gorillae TaxID=1243662 RepID=UPI0004B83E95|nr:CAP domain-containing protein [Paenibacillus gorillae]